MHYEVPLLFLSALLRYQVQKILIYSYLKTYSRYNLSFQLQSTSPHCQTSTSKNFKNPKASKRIDQICVQVYYNIEYHFYHHC